MSSFLKSVVLLLAVSASICYEQIDTHEELMNYHEINSQFPILHIYHNRHFSTSRQFQDFLEVLEETEYRNSDYARFVLSDCEKFKEGATFACDDMRKSKDNRMIFGYYPAENFVNYGGKRMQNPPRNRQFNHPLDIFTVQELENFLEEMVPNFYQEIGSLQQYEEWLKPRYAPKLLFASREEDIPLTLRKLGVHYFLRFDLAFLSDLTESVTKKLNLTSFPQLLVFKYNFSTKVYDVHPYDSNDFSGENYQRIKDFLEPFALKQPRNDLLFHMMKLQPDSGIIVSDNSAEVEEILDRASGWVLVSVVQGEPHKLRELRQKYGRFFTYLHYLAGNESETLQLFDSEKKTMFDMPEQEVHFKALPKDEFLQTLAVWLKKGFVLIGVREKYGHYCALSLQNFFRGHTHCLIVKEQYYQEVSKALNMQFEQGFACYETSENTKDKIVGRSLKGSYEDIYLSVEYLTRLKSKEIVDDFVNKPIKTIEGTDKLAEICAFPTKKCALLFTHSSKTDRTAYDYLKDIAINFINEYQFYEIDLACNPSFSQEIQVLRKNSGGLLVYHPKQKSYVTLKAKLSKSTFQKFLLANLSDKKLPLHEFQDADIKVHKCQNKKQKESSSEGDSL